MGVKVKALGPLCGPRPYIWWPPSGYQSVLIMWPPSPHLVAHSGPQVFFLHNVVCKTVLSTAIPHYVIIQQHFDSYWYSYSGWHCLAKFALYFFNQTWATIASFRLRFVVIQSLTLASSYCERALLPSSLVETTWQNKLCGSSVY